MTIRTQSGFPHWYDLTGSLPVRRVTSVAVLLNEELFTAGCQFVIDRKGIGWRRKLQ